MTAYVLLVFLLLHDGTLETRSHGEMIIGQELCMETKRAVEAGLQSNPQRFANYRVECVDSGLMPGREKEA